LSAPFSYFAVAQLRALTAAIESLGLIYVPFNLLPFSSIYSLRRQGLSCRVFSPRWFCEAHQLSAPCSASWQKTPARRGAFSYQN